MPPSTKTKGTQPRGNLRLIGEDLVRHLDHPGGTTPPYFAYVYAPADEFAVRRELQGLDLWLRSRDVVPVAISLAELFWRAIDESGYRDRIIEEEQAAVGSDDDGVVARLAVDINQILAGPPSLPDRVIATMADFPERSVTFLYRAGALYPSYRTSALLDDLRERLLRPVVLLYPGRLEGNYGLSFMGMCQPAHGYRAKIIAREAQ
ncbi:hypothetical protein BH20ACT3_BH20ACT3_10900 [soil metagenome]